VVANLKETDVARVAPGHEATVEIDAYPGRSFTAKVAAVAGATGARFSLLPPDNATGNYVKVVQRVPVRLDWAPPPDVPLRPGFSVEVTIDVGD
jgi:membrane fusion protein (multidrug efflux system)